MNDNAYLLDDPAILEAALIVDARRGIAHVEEVGK